MNIQLKGLTFATAILTLLSNTSIPAAMSKPEGSTPIYKIKQPISPRIIDSFLDPHPNSAQVRVLIDLDANEKVVCNEANISIKIQESPDNPNAPKDSLIAYYTVREEMGRLSQSNSNNTCIYNFKIQQSEIGKRASIYINGKPSTIVDGIFNGSSYYLIKNIKQTMTLNGRVRPMPGPN
jgi:hypothetical protein